MSDVSWSLGQTRLISLSRSEAVHLAYRELEAIRHACEECEGLEARPSMTSIPEILHYTRQIRARAGRAGELLEAMLDEKATPTPCDHTLK